MAKSYPISRRLLRLVAGAVLLACSACTATNAYYDASRPHHTPTGFRNNYLKEDIGSGFLKWQWQRLTQGLPKPPENGYQFPIDKPDLDWLKSNRTVTSATWIGHASMLVQINGVNLLTDPMFSKRAFAVQFIGPQRKVAPALTIAQLPRVDVVMISHNHYDHLDRDSIIQLAKQPGGSPLFLVPLGLKPWMAEQGVNNVRELDWWDKTSVAGLDFHLVPLQHWSARSLTDRFRTLWGGWTAHTPVGAARPFALFFAGDTGYSKDFVDIGTRFGGFDLALLPIGAYEPRWFMRHQHIDPPQAVQIHRDIGARESIGIHWGTFEMADEPIDEPPKALAAAVKAAGLSPDQFTVMRHGQTRRFP